MPLLALGSALILTRVLRDDPREGSARVDGPPVFVSRVAMSYVINYRVEVSRGEETTERLTVRRPFDSRFESFRGAAPLGGQVSSFGQLGIVSANGDPQVIDVPPAMAGFDQRADLVIADATAKGTLVRRERRRVASRDCQVYRAAGPLSDGLRPFDPAGNSYADVCLDEAGLLLEEVWLDGGVQLRRRVATDVVENPPLEGDTFRLDVTATVAPAQGGGVVRQLTSTVEPPGPFYLLDPPEGFRFQGRYVVVPPQGDQLVDPGQRGRRQAGIVDVWTRGPDYLVLDRGGTLGGDAPFQASPLAVAVSVGTLGTGELLADVRGSEVRVVLGGRYVRLAGSLPPGDIVALAGNVREVAGDGTLSAGSG